MWRVILSLLALTSVVWAYPTGAPSTVSVCSSMYPNHGYASQTSTPPYELVVNKDTYTAGEEVEVTLRRTGTASFRGFYIQARAVGSTDALGKFTTYDSGTTETGSCEHLTNTNAVTQNAVTQTGPTDKTSVTVTWTAPANRVGHVQFRATVVKTKAVFWVSTVKSVYVKDSTDIGVNSTGCGFTKGCFQVPTGCATPSCEYFSSWQASGENILFEISGTSNGYVAVGISGDTTMGSDDIYECVYDSYTGITTVYSSWSTGKSRPERDSTQGGISAVAGSYVNGAVSCKFTRAINDAAAGRKKRQTKVNNGRFYDLNSFYLLMSKGYTNRNILEYHATNHVVSSSTVDFRGNTQVHGAGVAACFKCKSEAKNSVLGGLPGDDTCLQDVRKENPTVQTVYCPPAAQCYTKITTGFGYASAIERGCWDDYDYKGDAVSCEAGEDSTCDGNTKTGTCFKCCHTTKCNNDFAQLDGVLNGVAGVYHLCVLTLLPVAVAMFV